MLYTPLAYMRILHVIQRYWPYTGGSERHLQEISERLVRDGHQVTVFTTDAWELECFWARGKSRVPVLAEEHEGVSIRRFPVRHVAPFWFAYPAIRRLMLTLSGLPVDTSPLLYPLARLTPWVPDLHRALAHGDLAFDLVAGMNIVFDALIEPALRFARRRRVPFVLYPLTHLGEEQNRIVRRYYTMRHQVRLMKESDALVLQTDIERQALVALGVSDGKMVTVGPGVNPQDVLGGQGVRFRAKYAIADPIVAHIGATAFDKGTHSTVEAMKLLWQQGNEATLVLAGPTMDAFLSYYRSQPESVREKCKVLGFIPEQDKRDLLDACDLVVLPSRTDSFGIVFLEAWLYDKPVIGARAGGIPAVISDGVDGFLVPFGDAEGLAQRVGELLADKALACRLGENGHRKVLAEMTWDHKYALVRNVYERAIQA